MYFIKYHVASGHILAHITVLEESHLAIHRQDGFELSPVGEQSHSVVDTSYIVQGGAIAARTKLTVKGGTISTGTGESIEITGLPADAWFKCGEDYLPVSNGKVVLTSAVAGRKIGNIVGKYTGPDFVLVWSDVTGLKAQTNLKIDQDAEAARSRVVTQGSGQAMTYLRKADAAASFLAGETLSAAQMQRLTDEAARLNVTVEQAATALAETANMWESIDANIDNIRLTKKAAVDAAVTGNQVAAIYKGIVWPV